MQLVFGEESFQVHQPGQQSIVGVAYVETDVRSAVREAMERADWHAFVAEGSHVALKPNLCWDLPLPGAQTSPWVFEAVIEVLKERVASITVVEANQVTVDCERALEVCGLGRVVRKHGLEFVNMSRGGFYRADLERGAILRHVEFPEALRDRVLVTLPVLKTHGTTGLTGAMKNQWGCLKELRHNYHLVVNEAIVDLNELLQPAFAVMDGTVGLEGAGPKTGNPRVADLILASGDIVALDATAARVMGFADGAIGHVRLAAERGLGSAERSEITVRGADISAVNLHFKQPEQNWMVKLEFALRRSPLRKLAFETKVLNLLAFAAKIYNAVWHAFVGRGRRERIVRETRYGAQWRGDGASEPLTPGPRT